MKKISLNDLKKAGIVGGAQASTKKAIDYKTPETESQGAKLAWEGKGESELIVNGAPAAAKLSPQQSEAAEKISR